MGFYQDIYDVIDFVDQIEIGKVQLLIGTCVSYWIELQNY